MLKNKYIPYVLLALSQGVLAQQPPSAGSQMQQIPPQPVPEKTTPLFEVEQARAPASPESEGVKIIVNSLRVTGAKAYSEADLLAVSGFVPGSELSLTDLRAMAAKVADFYRRNGYFVAQAYLPAQEIKDGVVTIAVIDGQYGKITLNNQTNLSNDMANGLLGGLNSGDPVTSAPLENRLLLLSDLPGVKVKSTLAPGVEPGTSDLLVDITPGPRVSGSIDADNAGNRYTGEYRLGATINLNNPTGHGDVASLRLMTAGPGLHYARASYTTQVGKGRVGVAYSQLDYSLGQEFESLRANGTVNIASVFGSYPLIRSRNSNLYAGIGLDQKTFQDKVDSTGTVADKTSRVLVTSLYGDQRDNLGGGGLSIYSLALSAGVLDLQTPSVKLVDDTTARSNGQFNKLAFNVMRLQRLTDNTSFYAALNGQVASKNLDVSEKMELGGMYAVRAYPEGEGYGDEGYVLTMEARMQLRKLSDRMPGQLQLIGFVDVGTITIHKNPWAAGQNTRTLSGAGVGLNWTVTGNFVVRAYYAQKLGNEVATSAPDASGRFWIQAVKYF